ncbi:MAG: hypothetical protein MJ237_07825 [bacterium]|nr:hypothetical protein [bacterium]
MPINPATLYSVLGNPNSLVPLAIKDVSATAGMTAGSLITGKEEGIDRLIDECGTAFIWLFGIPISKAVFNFSIFKPLKLDSKFDARNFKDKEILKKIKEYAPDEKVKNSIEKVISKERLFKSLVTTRFIASTVITIVSYLVLTKFKQKYTENKIKENLIQEYNEKLKQEQAEKEKKSVIADNFEGSPSFKGMGAIVENFAFSPVKNMWILDGAITLERLKDSRNPQEFVGYAIKEGILLTFLYYAGGKIQSLIEKHSKKKFNKSIELDARVLANEEFKKAFEDGSIEKSLEQFKSANTSNTALYDFLHKNPDNLVVKSAKQSDIIKNNKVKEDGFWGLFKKKIDTGKIDTREYIDLEDVKGVNNKISELYSQYRDALAKGETSEKFFNGVKKLKIKSVLANIGISILALGIITPGIMVAKRFLSKDDKEFETKKEIREKLIADGVIA